MVAGESGFCSLKGQVSRFMQKRWSQWCIHRHAWDGIPLGLNVLHRLFILNHGTQSGSFKNEIEFKNIYHLKNKRMFAFIVLALGDVA